VPTFLFKPDTQDVEGPFMTPAQAADALSEKEPNDIEITWVITIINDTATIEQAEEWYDIHGEDGDEELE